MRRLHPSAIGTLVLLILTAACGHEGMQAREEKVLTDRAAVLQANIQLRTRAAAADCITAPQSGTGDTSMSACNPSDLLQRFTENTDGTIGVDGRPGMCLSKSAGESPLAIATCNAGLPQHLMELTADGRLRNGTSYAKRETGTANQPHFRYACLASTLECLWDKVVTSTSQSVSLESRASLGRCITAPVSGTGTTSMTPCSPSEPLQKFTENANGTIGVDGRAGMCLTKSTGESPLAIATCNAGLSQQLMTLAGDGRLQNGTSYAKRETTPVEQPYFRYTCPQTDNNCLWNRLGNGDGGAAACTATDSWSTYGHDAQRTSASGGCVRGNLTYKWAYQPPVTAPRELRWVEHVLARTDAAFVSWNGTPVYAGYGGVPNLAQVLPNGTAGWSFDREGLNDNRGNWPSLVSYTRASNARVGLLRSDDGLRLWSDTGALFYPATPTIPSADQQFDSNDSWGQTLEGGGRMWSYNAQQYHGPQMGLRGIPSVTSGAQLSVDRSYNSYGSYITNPVAAGEWGTVRDTLGALAFGTVGSGDTQKQVIYLAARYQFSCGPSGGCPPQPVSSGLYAWDTANASTTALFSQTATFHSKISLSSERIYAVESRPGGLKLVVRDGSTTGAVIGESVVLSGTVSFQAPVIANGKVFVVSQNGSCGRIQAWPIIAGGLGIVQTQDLNPCRSGVVTTDSDSYGNRYSGGAWSAGVTTTLAAANGSRNAANTASEPTLVLAYDVGVLVLKQSDLSTLQTVERSVFYPSGTGAVRNPVIVGNRLYVVDTSRVYAFDSP